MSSSSPTVTLADPKTASRSYSRVIFGALFLLVFLFRYALYPYFDAIPNLLVNDSWWYDFSRFLCEGKFLGVDFFFTYGPLAQQLGPLIEAGQKTGWPGMVFEFSIIALYLSAFWDLSALFEETHPLKRLAFYFSTLAFALFYPLLYRQSEAVYDILVFVTGLNFFLNSQKNGRGKKELYILLFLSVTLLQFKFSTGILALTFLFCASVFWAFRKKAPKFLLSLFLAGMAGSFLLFYLLTGHWNFIGFCAKSWSSASAYSEIMASHSLASPGSGLIYVLGLLCIFSYLYLVVHLAEVYRFGGAGKGALLATFGFSGFYFFKHGFVRADQHTLEFYLTLLPLTFLLAGLSLVRIQPLRRDFYMVCVILSLGFLAGFSNGRMFTNSVGDLELRGKKRIQNYWFENPVKVFRFLTGTGDIGKITGAKVNYCMLQDYPGLYKVLDSIDHGKDKTRESITFSPWTNILAAAVPQFRLVPAPSLQIYNAATQIWLERLDQRFLSSEDRPDVVVLGSDTLDDRNSLSEFNAWLGPLLRYYRPLGVFDRQTVLVRKPTRPFIRIQRLTQGPGLFFRLKTPSMGPLRNALFSLAKTLFKAPEIKVRVEMVNTRGKRRVLLSRGFYSQLREGVYFGVGPIGRLLMECRREPSARSELWFVKSAVAFRARGWYNLPVFPETMPLKVEYCRVRRTF